MRALFLLLVIAGFASPAMARTTQRTPASYAGMARIPAGQYRPLYATRSGVPERVAGFLLDREPVTQDEYLAFVRREPKWRRSAVRRVFAEREYLSDWAGDLAVGSTSADRRPVTRVSWFAARAYCESRGKRLPTTGEWEYAANASETERNANGDAQFTRRILSMYATRSSTRATAIGDGFRNAFGVADLHGVVWEWTLDFNATVVADDSRAAGSGADARDHHLFCASAAIGAADPTNYPAFLRYAVRSGLTGRTTMQSLGFRCAADLVS